MPRDPPLWPLVLSMPPSLQPSMTLASTSPEAARDAALSPSRGRSCCQYHHRLGRCGRRCQRCLKRQTMLQDPPSSPLVISMRLLIQPTSSSSDAECDAARSSVVAVGPVDATVGSACRRRRRQRHPTRQVMPRDPPSLPSVMSMPPSIRPSSTSSSLPHVAVDAARSTVVAVGAVDATVNSDVVDVVLVIVAQRGR